MYNEQGCYDTSARGLLENLLIAVLSLQNVLRIQRRIDNDPGAAAPGYPCLVAFERHGLQVGTAKFCRYWLVMLTAHQIVGHRTSRLETSRWTVAGDLDCEDEKDDQTNVGASR